MGERRGVWGGGAGLGRVGRGKDRESFKYAQVNIRISHGSVFYQALLRFASGFNLLTITICIFNHNPTLFLSYQDYKMRC